MARMAEQEGAVAVEHDQGIERKEEDIESFWSNTSYKVVNRGRTSTAFIDFMVPADKLGQPYGMGFSAASDIQCARAAAGEEKNDWGLHRRGCELDEISFPWANPTAVSRESYAEGVHEFLVEVGSIGQLGLVDAAFVDERSKVMQHWMTESNNGRAWVLHGSGYIAEGSKTTRCKGSKFCALDHILVRLDQFRGQVSWSCVNGSPRLLGSAEGIEVPVRLGFQMTHTDDSVTILSHRDVTDELDAMERAEGYQIRGERFLAKAAPLNNAGADHDEQFVKMIPIAISAFDKASRAYSNLQESGAKDKSLAMYLESKRMFEEASARIKKRFEIEGAPR